MMNDKLGIDEKDSEILRLFQEDPTISQSAIASKIGISQPAVGMRMQKLRKKGVISSVIGMNFKKVGLFLAKVDVATNDTEKVIKSFDQCPFFLNGLIVSGTDNLCLFMMSPDMTVLEGVINYHLRAHPNVKNVKMDVVIAPVKDFVMPVSLCAAKPKNKTEFKDKCDKCPNRKVFS
jgi:Lrp/AsnC family leucine-responsive transcriptional regulator